MRDYNHPDDYDLALALDGEHPVGRQGALDAHLIECPSCKTRQMRMDELAKDAVGLDQLSGGEREWHEAARARLRSALAVEARAWKAPLSERFASMFVGMPRWAVLAAGVLASVLIGRAASSNFQPAKTPVAVEEGGLPIASLTPGATWSVTVEELCNPAVREQRSVAREIREQVLRGYRMEHVPPEEYELDYLITPELGGAPDPRNLWPQRYASRTWNAHVKDQLEAYLPKLVCEGALPLQTAQREIAVDWISAYKKYFRTDVPIQTVASLASGAAALVDDDLTYPVWRSATAPALVLVSFDAQR